MSRCKNCLSKRATSATQSKSTHAKQEQEESKVIERFKTNMGIVISPELAKQIVENKKIHILKKPNKKASLRPGASRKRKKRKSKNRKNKRSKKKRSKK